MRNYLQSSSCLSFAKPTKV